MLKKLLIRSLLLQIGSVLVALLCVFVFFGVYSKQKTDEIVAEKINKLREIPIESFFNQTIEISEAKAIQDGTVILVSYNEEGYRIRKPSIDVCTYEQAESIVRIAVKGGDGIVKTDDKIFAYYYSDYNASEKISVVYVSDISEDYNDFKESVIMLVLVGVFVSTVVVLFYLFFARKNQIPVETAFKKQKSLIADASHELKTPLTILTAQVDALKNSETPLTEEQKGWVDAIDNQLDRMTRLINGMLELSRFEVMHNTAAFQRVDFSKLAEGVMLGIEVLAFENNITLETKIPKGICIYADPDGMEKVVYALLENAVKYTPIREKISVVMYVEKRKVFLHVKNTGVGVPSSEIPKLFDRFYRGDPAHTSSNNFGLGLPIVKSIVEANKGIIAVSSKEKEYTEFVVIMKESENGKRLEKYEKKKNYRKH